ncbi:hypothetical protein TrVE_jg13553 [Triparma verrucosa]|uniref:Uncharacterized protein n=1 Tax=Triparma verrucosa TaxID=1606542 RepID=A0A9W7KVJ8_9STRA|nr:hypothetical protein TrVE_jg13553 [Triparma verrucosa]
MPSASLTSLASFLAVTSAPMVQGFHMLPSRPSFVARHVHPPKGSPYYQPEDEPNPLPSGYAPLLEYPGTMRPSKVRENSPFEDLPLKQSLEEAQDEETVTLPSTEVENGGCGVNVPWPHFQDIPYHVTWGSANESEPPIEEFIEEQGRWLTAEEEEELTRHTRSAAPKSQEAVVIDDDDDDEEEGSNFEDDFDVSSKLDEAKDADDEDATNDVDDDDDEDDDEDLDDNDDDDDDTDDDEDEDDEALLDDMLGF